MLSSSWALMVSAYHHEGIPASFSLLPERRYHSLKQDNVL
jgi:hypothetical protein